MVHFLAQSHKFYLLDLLWLMGEISHHNWHFTSVCLAAVTGTDFPRTFSFIEQKFSSHLYVDWMRGLLTSHFDPNFQGFFQFSKMPSYTTQLF
ncbi:hypothetical protein Pcinc_003266 [Petrolisthes cinctipes]|uniref:Uncharacterized protein n=1 Tax=Petrolisthes cinctipes TaxID=88211 RepID=A0AAE1L4U6_PETCI|nr:hypothetical protein Pcinc_003266 [Petrolisthes cinctipes]